MDPRDLPTRPARRPAGWRAPGPRPRGTLGDPTLDPQPGEERSLLAGDFQLFQLVRGHRWSMDDLVTAFVAIEQCRARWPDAVGDGATRALRYLDMGCGIGSVLLQCAWAFPQAICSGIEAQTVSASMARRSSRFNGVDHRVTVVDGDLRDPEALALENVGQFSIVTGTPPYFRDGEGVESVVIQRGPCRFEHRGGVEAYSVAAARWLAPDGRFVLCAGALERPRMSDALAESGLRLHEQLEVIPRAGKSPLIDVYVLAHEPPGGAVIERTLTVRGADEQWTDAFVRVRETLGMPAQRR